MVTNATSHDVEEKFLIRDLQCGFVIQHTCLNLGFTRTVALLKKLCLSTAIKMEVIFWGCAILKYFGVSFRWQ